MDFRCRLKRNGFSLTEVMITMGLIAGVAGGASTMLMFAADMQQQAWSQSRTKNEAYTAVERVCREIREAKLIKLNVDGGVSLDATRQDDSVVRYEIVWGDDGFGTLIFYRDLERMDALEIAYGISQIDGFPVFSRNQNTIYLNFRIGDVEGSDYGDAEGAQNVQGVDIRTVAVQRPGA